MPLDFLASVVQIFLIHGSIIEVQRAPKLGLRFVVCSLILIIFVVFHLFTAVQELAKFIALDFLGRCGFQVSIYVKGYLLGVLRFVTVLITKYAFYFRQRRTDIYLINAIYHFKSFLN